MSRVLSRLRPLAAHVPSFAPLPCFSVTCRGKLQLYRHNVRSADIPQSYAKVVAPPETKGISQTEYELRRSLLVDSLPDDSVCILLGASKKYLSDSVFYPFHQDPNFFYLTGFVERDALAVIRKDHKVPKEYTYHLFVLPMTAGQEKWDGLPIGTDAAVKHYNADQAFLNTQISSELSPLLHGAQYIYVSFPTISGSIADDIRPRPHFLANTSRHLPFLSLDDRYKPLVPSLHSLRSVKSSSEIACLRQAGRISGNVFNEVMRRNLQREDEIDATLEYFLRLGGCKRAAYIPVVAGGKVPPYHGCVDGEKNALTIHYTQNCAEIPAGEMVLVDAGGLYEGYVSDITRTWPVCPTFTEPQRDLYQAVLNVQRECVKMCYEGGNKTLEDLHRQSVDSLTRELRNLGFQLGYRDVERTLYPHHVSHHVGLEVHDCSTLPKGLPLKKGNCITIEPGVYIPDNDQWPKHFRGMGIRIEDCVVVGEEKGKEVILTVDAVKEIVDIEALREQ